MVKYTSSFFDYVDSGALRSARAIITWLFPVLNPSSVLDVGCGRGGWLKVWRETGCPIIYGVDGDYVDRNSLHVALDEFQPTNISEGFDLGRRFDLVQCLEVAEHIQPAASETLIDSIIRHADIVLFSAAQPGQGGTQHINERPLNYWRELFKARDYRPYDCIRPKFRADDRIEPWYRFNSIIYANEAGEKRLPGVITETAVRDGTAFQNVAPFHWRLRCAVFRCMPVAVMDQFAVLNAKLRQLRSPATDLRG